MEQLLVQSDFVELVVRFEAFVYSKDGAYTTQVLLCLFELRLGLTRSLGLLISNFLRRIKTGYRLSLDLLVVIVGFGCLNEINREVGTRTTLTLFQLIKRVIFD